MSRSFGVKILLPMDHYNSDKPLSNIGLFTNKF